MSSRTDLRFEIPAPIGPRNRDSLLELLQGRAVVRDEKPSEALVAQWAKEAAMGSPDAQYQLARSLTAGEPISADNRNAVKWLKKAAEKEHAASEHLLGVLIARGQGIRPDPEKAVALFRAAAIMGNPDAQYDLARALSWGFGVATNPKEALIWFRLAASQGHESSILAVGKAYTEGIGCSVDLRQAVTWLKKAAQMGSLPAQRLLAGLYLRPDNPSASEKEGLRWLSEAARAGDPDSQHELALFIWSGRQGGDKTAAAHWAARAARSGSSAAYLLLSRIREKGGRLVEGLSLLYLASKHLAKAEKTPENEAAVRQCLLRITELEARLSDTSIDEAKSIANDVSDAQRLLLD